MPEDTIQPDNDAEWRAGMTRELGELRKTVDVLTDTTRLLRKHLREQTPPKEEPAPDLEPAPGEEGFWPW